VVRDGLALPWVHHTAALLEAAEDALDRGNAMSRHRVGLALPVGMRGRKPQ